jgi:hypothetical protein
MHQRYGARKCIISRVLCVNGLKSTLFCLQAHIGNTVSSQQIVIDTIQPSIINAHVTTYRSSDDINIVDVDITFSEPVTEVQVNQTDTVTGRLLTDTTLHLSITGRQSVSQLSRWCSTKSWLTAHSHIPLETLQ